MILLQQHNSFLWYPVIEWRGQLEFDILELGERVTIALNDEQTLGGASKMYWWRSEGWHW